jgi:hypothetical protein
LSGRKFPRDGGAPRSVLILLVLLLAAVGGLLLVKNNEPTSDFTHGGLLFPAERGEVEGLLLTRQGAQYRLDRTEDNHWLLSGAMSDYVDSMAVVTLLDNLTGARGGPLLPGTEVEDRRYEFNGPDSIRLTMFLTGRKPITLALGTGNPVSGRIYASGAGREACFMVPAALSKVLGDVPGSVQARVLLPRVDQEKIERLELRRGSRAFAMKKIDGRWWMDMPAEGPGYLGQDVLVYQAEYSDRRLTDDEGTWVLASEAAMGLMIYEVSHVIVREFKSPREGGSLLGVWDLDPAWRGVTLIGAGLNPDPSADSPDRMTIDFGPALGANSVPALRRGNVLVTDGEALNSLDQPVGSLAHRTALNSVALKADTMELEREGRLLVRGTRTGVAETDEGRMAWLTEIPAADQVAFKESTRHGLSRDVVVNLDRIEILTVLPATDDPQVLADRERVKITLKFGSAEDAVSEVLEFGYLVADRLPTGSRALATDENGAPPVGLWFPGSGKLLQVSSQVVVTARNLVPLVAPTSAPPVSD